MQQKGEESLSLEWNRIEPKRIGKARTRKGRDATERRRRVEQRAEKEKRLRSIKMKRRS